MKDTTYNGLPPLLSNLAKDGYMPRYLAARGDRLGFSNGMMILVSGGMSVDPDDVTPAAIKEMGAEVITYGAPVLPGAMFMLAYLGDVPIMGLPGCVMYSKKTVFDLVAPRVLTGERPTRLDNVFEKITICGMDLPKNSFLSF